MYFYIKEWPNKTATLMAENGTVLWTFQCVEEAMAICREWYNVNAEDVEYFVDTQNLDPACASCSVG